MTSPILRCTTCGRVSDANPATAKAPGATIKLLCPAREGGCAKTTVHVYDVLSTEAK